MNKVTLYLVLLVIAKMRPPEQASPQGRGHEAGAFRRGTRGFGIRSILRAGTRCSRRPGGFPFPPAGGAAGRVVLAGAKLTRGRAAMLMLRRWGRTLSPSENRRFWFPLNHLHLYVMPVKAFSIVINPCLARSMLPSAVFSLLPQSFTEWLSWVGERLTWHGGCLFGDDSMDNMAI